MGGKQSKSQNVIDDVINITSNNINTVVQSSGAYGNVSNILEFKDCDEVVVDGLNQTAAVTINFKSLQDSAQSSETQNNIEENVKQKMDVTCQALQLSLIHI